MASQLADKTYVEVRVEKEDFTGNWRILSGENFGRGGGVFFTAVNPSFRKRKWAATAAMHLVSALELDGRRVNVTTTTRGGKIKVISRSTLYMWTRR